MRTFPPEVGGDIEGTSVAVAEQVAVDQHRGHEARLRRRQEVPPEALPHLDAERSGVGREAQQSHSGAESGRVGDAIGGPDLVVQDRFRCGPAQQDAALGVCPQDVCPLRIRRLQDPRRQGSDAQPSVGLGPGVQQAAAVVKPSVQQEPSLGELSKGVVYRAKPTSSRPPPACEQDFLPVQSWPAVRRPPGGWHGSAPGRPQHVWPAPTGAPGSRASRSVESCRPARRGQCARPVKGERCLARPGS